jgi:hypothetical protein
VIAGWVERRVKIAAFKKSALSALGITIALALYIFLFSETSFSNAVVSWHSEFETALLTTGEVKLQSLVKFPYDKIYFIEPFDRFDARTESEEFSYANWRDPLWFWWRGDEKYWTIAYRRKNREPFLIRLNKNEWNLRQQTKLWTVDPEARLSLAQSEPPVHCTRPRARCLALSERRPN